MSPLLEACQSRFGLSSPALQGEKAVSAENMVKIALLPNARRGHGLNQIETSQEDDFGTSLGSVVTVDASHGLVDLVVNMI